MIKSMTGFGQARGIVGLFQCSIEIRSWNHRFFECSTRLPSVLNGFEDKIRDRIREKVNRGKIAATVTLRSNAGKSELVLDESKIDLYLRTIRRIQKKHGLGGDINVGTLLAIPNLLTAGPREELSDAEWKALNRILDEAAQKLLKAKLKEGAALAKDFEKRIGLIAADLELIRELAKDAVKRVLEKLKVRVSELAGQTTLDNGRLESEAVMLAERSDITEEIVRAFHHVDTFRKSLKSAGEVGKKLDFLAQEMHREINTIGSKAQDVAISDCVIRVKSELEKIREQIQNVE